MKINSKILAGFLSNVTINGMMSDALLKFGPEGITTSIKDMSNSIFSSGLLRINAGISDYKQMEFSIKNTRHLIEYLRSVNGDIEIDVSSNNLVMKSADNDGLFKLIDEQYLQHNLKKFPILDGHDAGFEVDTKIFTTARKNAINLGTEHIFAEVKDKVFYLTAGEDEFNQLISHITVDYKNVERTLYGDVLLDLIPVLNKTINVTFAKDYPMLITMTDVNTVYKFLLAPLVVESDGSE